MAPGTLNQTAQALSLVAGEPGVDGVGMAGLEQAFARNAVGRPALGNLEQGRCPLAQVGPRVGVPRAFEFDALGGGQRKGSVAVKDRILLVGQENSTPLAPFSPALLPVT
jgi:hypothetical protein